MSGARGPLNGLLATLLRMRGETVTYRRGEQSVEWRAAVTRSELAVDQEAQPQRYQWWDFIGPAAELTLGGQVVRPEPGDEIEREEGEETHLYEVLPPSDGQQHFRFSDPQKLMLRIHAKYVGLKPAEPEDPEEPEPE